MRPFLSITALTGLLVFASLGCGSEPAVAVDVPDSLILYALDPREPTEQDLADPEKFHGYAIRGKVEIPEAARKAELLGALAQGVKDSDGTVAACFQPRHGLRITRHGKTIDQVICFECHSYLTYDETGKQSTIVASTPQPVFNRFLKAAGIEPAP